MGGEDWEVRREVHCIVERHAAGGPATRRFIAELAEIMRSEDRAEFVRLMQKWLAVS